MSGQSPAERRSIPAPKLPAVDVLRGVAALGVTWFHSRVDLWVGFRAIQADPSAYSTSDRLLTWGSLPVSQLGGLVMLFFVLSGFCIHLPNALNQQPLHLGVYAVRRWFRIVPAYLVTLLLCLLASMLLQASGNGPASDLRLYALSALLLQNWVADGAQIALNPSLWTIPVEVEFYLVYPLLLWLWRCHGLAAAAGLTLLCTLIGAALFASGSAWAGTTFFGYALIWNAGAWLAEAFSKGRLPHWSGWHTLVFCIALVLNLVAGVLNVSDYWLHYGWGLVSVLLLQWMLGAGRQWFASERRWLRPWVFIGTLSYSLYLLHFPVFKLMGVFWLLSTGAKPASFMVPTAATVAMVLVALPFYHWVEWPSHQLARGLGGSMAKRCS